MKASEQRLLLRWSLRDLRRRWLQVGAIALILAIGTGTLASLGATATWRRLSNDASFAALATHDVRVRLATATFTTEGTLLDAVAGVDGIASAEERLIVDTQFETEGADERVLAKGRIVGAAARDVDRVDLVEGTAEDAVIELQFADHWKLPTAGVLELPGGTTLAFSGRGQGPEYFIVVDEAGSFLAQAAFGVVFTDLATAQAVAARPGEVNDLVLRAGPGIDRDALAAAIDEAVRTNAPDIGATVETIEDDPSYHLLYQDIEGDQRVWNVITFLVLAGAAIAVFNIVTRVVESQRREIGIGMALGVPRRRLAIRPLLFGLEISAIGAVAGIVVGVLLGQALRAVFVEFLPLPVWRTPFQYGSYARAAALGFLLPALAVGWPIWRAVRTEPVDVMYTGPRAARGGRFLALTRRIPLPGRAWHQMTTRNLLRTPRRTLLTAMSIGAAIAVLVAILGMLDTFSLTLRGAERDLLRTSPDRVITRLDGFQLASSEEVDAIKAIDGVAAVDIGLELPGTLAPDTDDAIDVFLEFVDLATAAWIPEAVDGSLPAGGNELLLSEKAAADLDVSPGDTVDLRVPERTATGYRYVVQSMTVTGLHTTPLRSLSYLDLESAEILGLDGVTNVVTVSPEAGVSSSELRAQLFDLDVIASMQTVGETTAAYDEAISQFTGVLRAMEAVILGLALLIAFNASVIAADERRREHATMFAFGLPVRTVVSLSMVESAVLGLLGTIVGLVTGTYVLHWIINSVVAETIPDLWLPPRLAVGTIVTAVVLGVVAVAIAPLLTVRRLRRLDVPGALRIIE